MIARSEFSITRWETEDPYDAPASGPPQSRVFVDKTFSGDLVGASSATLLTCQVSHEQAGYVASERLAVSIDGRAGTFVIQHGGLVDGKTIYQFGNIVHGSGTDDLVGIRGIGVYRHDTSGAVLTLTYDFA